jgi:spore coat protein A
MTNQLSWKYGCILVTLLALQGYLPAQTLLDPVQHPKFEIALPNPIKIDATNGGLFEMEMAQGEQWLGLRDANGLPLPTTVWGYGLPGSATYPGPTIEARHGVAVDVRWLNNLPSEHLLPVDTTIHRAHPQLGGVPAVVHLHGGHSEAASDGHPEAWFTPGFLETGPDFVKEIYHYDNDNEAATLWYHDHALGITRLNVYAGLAGFYFVRDANEQALREAGVLPDVAFEREIVFQDRMFAADGQLYFPSEPEESGQPEVSVLPEFFGDFIVVNGVVWPYLEVEPRKYRFRLLNGCDSRFLIIEFHADVLQIATDNGLLEKPVVIDELLLAPGERAEVIMDFNGLTPGFETTLTNRGPDEPFRGLNPDGSLNDGEGGELEPADPQTTGQLLRFRVVQPQSPLPDAIVNTGTVLRPPIAPLDTAGANVRRLVLFEAEDAFGRLRPQLGIYDPGSPLNGSLLYGEEPTEIVPFGDVEIWEVYNATEDAHPIHLHLVAYQLLNRQRYDGEVEEVGEDPHTGGTKLVLEVEELEGPAQAPAANEKGWKDTGVMLPGQVTRLAAKFDRAGQYVWHCHILSHEDHEMMRRLVVMDDVGTSPDPVLPAWLMAPARPNPFAQRTTVEVDLPAAGLVRWQIFQADGKAVWSPARLQLPAGRSLLSWNATDGSGAPVADGLYFGRLTYGDQSTILKLLVQREP